MLDEVGRLDEGEVTEDTYILVWPGSKRKEDNREMCLGVEVEESIKPVVFPDVEEATEAAILLRDHFVGLVDALPEVWTWQKWFLSFSDKP